MDPKELAGAVRRRPFTPFRLTLTEGSTYDVRHPEQLMLARASVVIGVPDQTGKEDFFETTVLVDLFHVVRLEPLPTQAASTGSA